MLDHKKNDKTNKLFEQKTISIDFSLKELDAEAKALFKVLDNTSDQIRQLEKSLTDAKAHFTFRLPLKEEGISGEKPPKDTHWKAYPHKAYPNFYTRLSGYRTKVTWYLSWEPVDENSKTYRVFLIAEEKEIVEYEKESESYEKILNNDGGTLYYDEFKTECIFKRPLIETDLQTRLQYSEYLIPFVDTFKKYLSDFRFSIEAGGNPFSK